MTTTTGISGPWRRSLRDWWFQGLTPPRKRGELLQDLPALWNEADLAQGRKLLLTMLDAVYVDTVDEKAIVAILPKPAFMPLFEIATTRKGSKVVLINEPPQASTEPEAADLCCWWRRGRVELGLKHGLAVVVAISSARFSCHHHRFLSGNAS